MKIEKNLPLKKCGTLVFLLLIGVFLSFAIATSKSSSIQHFSVLSLEQENEEVITSSHSSSVQTLGISESYLRAFFISAKVFKQVAYKEQIPSVCPVIFKAYSKVDNLFSYEFLRLNILSAKHHPPTVC